MVVEHGNANLEEAALPLPLLLDLLHLLQHQLHLTVCLHSGMMAGMLVCAKTFLPVVPVVHDSWLSYLAIRNLICLILFCLGIPVVMWVVALGSKLCLSVCFQFFLCLSQTLSCFCSIGIMQT